jgi:hypothetical protein
MQQILQSLKTGAVDLVDAPVPTLRAGHLLIATRRSPDFGGYGTNAGRVRPGQSAGQGSLPTGQGAAGCPLLMSDNTFWRNLQHRGVKPKVGISLLKTMISRYRLFNSRLT